MHLSQRAQSSPRGKGEWFLYQPLFKDSRLGIVGGRAPARPVLEEQGSKHFAKNAKQNTMRMGHIVSSALDGPTVFDS